MLCHNVYDRFLAFAVLRLHHGQSTTHHLCSAIFAYLKALVFYPKAAELHGFVAIDTAYDGHLFSVSRRVMVGAGLSKGSPRPLPNALNFIACRLNYAF